MENADNACACAGERLLRRGCICCPYNEIRWQKALPTRALTSDVSIGDAATWAKILTNSGIREWICNTFKNGQTWLGRIILLQREQQNKESQISKKKQLPVDWMRIQE